MSEPIFIGGEWKPGRGPDMVSIYPADGTENAVVAGANAADVDESVMRAKAAMADPDTHAIRLARHLAKPESRPKPAPRPKAPPRPPSVRATVSPRSILCLQPHWPPG